MTLDWSATNLAEGLEAYNLYATDKLKKVLEVLQANDGDVSEVYLILDGLETYADTWKIEDAVWLVVAVVRMVSEILEDYRATSPDGLPLLGGNPTEEMMLLVPLAMEQTIVHRIWTAYQELYDILSRTQRKSGARVWHRRATTKFFPELRIEIADSETYPTDDSPEDSLE